MKGRELNIPSPKELEKELNEYLTRKYGDHVKLAVPMLAPEPQIYGTEEDGRKKGRVSAIHFDMKPEELEAYLDRYVIKQKEAKEVLATKICTHFNRINYQKRGKGTLPSEGVGYIKNNIIMIGPTGVGKTYLIKLIADKIGVPFVKGDATKFSETGYVGGDVEDLVRDLVHEGEGDIELAQYGIVYVDEIDKIASSNNLIGPDVSRTGVQRALLKPMEETNVDLKVPHDIVSQMEAVEEYRKTGKKEKKTINTKNILFIVSGAFNGLEEIIQKRVHKQGIGFGADVRSKGNEGRYLGKVASEDLIEYGFESEFVGRLPVRTVFEQLEVEDLYQILKNPNSPVVSSKKRDFRAYGVDVRFEDEALHGLARKAYQEKTGARGLVNVIESVLIKFEKKLPSTEITRLVVTKDLVRDPETVLAEILKNPDDPHLLARYNRLIDSEKGTLKARLKAEQESAEGQACQPLSERRVDLIINRVVHDDSELHTTCAEVASLISSIRDYERAFGKDSDLRVAFDDRALDVILQECLGKDVDIDKFCDNLLKNYTQGLQLIREKTGETDFVLTEEAVRRPEAYLNQLIRESYRE
jgi:endopeptidase Clp ATP-binding regulatory subunit ClpX